MVRSPLMVPCVGNVVEWHLIAPSARRYCFIFIFVLQKSLEIVKIVSILSFFLLSMAWRFI